MELETIAKLFLDLFQVCAAFHLGVVIVLNVFSAQAEIVPFQKLGGCKIHACGLALFLKVFQALLS